MSILACVSKPTWFIVHRFYYILSHSTIYVNSAVTFSFICWVLASQIVLFLLLNSREISWKNRLLACYLWNLFLQTFLLKKFCFRGAKFPMACSAVTLSFATITAVVAVACLAIAFGTDNWYEIRVNRTYIEEREPVASQRDFDEDVRYFSRDVGLFRICFPDSEKPKKG